jgi:hypothetical protein
LTTPTPPVPLLSEKEPGRTRTVTVPGPLNVPVKV